jgi:hypothetical protein
MVENIHGRMIGVWPILPGLEIVLPQDMVVRESRGRLILVGIGLLAFAAFLAFIAADELTDGDVVYQDVILLAFLVAGLFASLSSFKAAWSRKVVLVAFRTGLFFPLIHPEVISWKDVESVRVTAIGRGTSVLIALSEEFEAGLSLPRLPLFLNRLGRAVGLHGWMCGGHKNRSNRAIVHAIDDWILYDRGKRIKPRYEPGVVDFIIDKLSPSN